MPEESICICICTYKRSGLLHKLIGELDKQEIDDRFSFSLLIVDNDSDQSAHPVFEEMKHCISVQIQYVNEPDRNFAKVRNRAVKEARGDLIAFIDDDEYPHPRWLLSLYNCFKETDADGVLGPVIPDFAETPPKWLIRSGLANRNRFKTGKTLTPRDTRTGNLLINKDIFQDTGVYFDPLFGLTGGEDVDLFIRLINKGKVFIWCDEAPVFETVPENRMKLRYYFKRAYLRGFISFNYKRREMNSFLRMKIIVKSLLAIFIYSLSLPVLVFHIRLFLNFIIKIINHFSRLITAMGFNRQLVRNI